MVLKHSKARDKRAISYHYDVSNEFYKLFLGKNMVYSCAYFRRESEDIDQAQENKLRHICKKLRLKPGEKLLDIGCGWGSLIIYAAKHFGVEAHGITLSRNQYDYAREKIEKENLGNSCKVKLLDYRDLRENGAYDKIVSVGMFEHVGIKKYPIYFGAAYRLLRDKGLFLNHGITDREMGRKKSAGSKFISAYVFPDGELDNIAHILEVMKKTKFEILDVESLRGHYALTLEHWVRNLERNKQKALSLAPEKAYRIWRIYMAGCSYVFRRGGVSVYQTLASKHSLPGFPEAPLTREDIYRD